MCIKGTAARIYVQPFLFFLGGDGMQLNNGVGAVYVAPDGNFYDNGSDYIGVIYELTLGDMVIVLLLGLILMTLIVSTVVRELWRK